MLIIIKKFAESCNIFKLLKNTNKYLNFLLKIFKLLYLYFSFLFFFDKNF